MLPKDHEMGLFPQKKKIENKQTTGKAVSSLTHAGSGTGAFLSTRKDTHDHCAWSSFFQVELPLGSNDSKPQLPSVGASSLP